MPVADAALKSINLLKNGSLKTYLGLSHGMLTVNADVLNADLLAFIEKKSNVMSSSPIEIANTFFAHWNANRIDEALAMLSDDVLYDNVPFPDIVGRENVRKFHSDFGLGTSFKVDWKIKQIAVDGHVVLNERVDVFIHESGGKIILPVMGTLTVENGMITVWRDYFDPTDFDKQLKAIK